MPRYDPHKHHRRSIRYARWDYRAPASYFVTICTHERQNLFSNQLFCDLAAQAMNRIPSWPSAAHIELDEWVVMPNHVHAILVIKHFLPQMSKPEGEESLQNALAGSIGVIVGHYKTAVTQRINHLRKSQGAKVWQRGYYDRIIRNEREWVATQQYIRNNPVRWAEDRENLDNILAKMTLHL